MRSRPEPSDELNISAGHITLAEIKNSIKKMSGKAPGCDNIPPVAIKCGGEVSGEVLLGTRGVEKRMADQAAKERRSEPL